MWVFTLLVLLVLVFGAWLTDHIGLWRLVREHARVNENLRKERDSYRLSLEHQKLKTDCVQQEKNNLVFKASHEMANLKAKIRKFAKELEETVS